VLRAVTDCGIAIKSELVRSKSVLESGPLPLIDRAGCEFCVL
jgi:hypothetical protein